MPLLQDPQSLRAAVDRMAEWAVGRHVDVVLGAESRGFILGSAVAYALNAGFVCARKPGKLPFTTVSESYELEYGSDALEVHEDAIEPGMNVLVHDDLLATGGTAVGQGAPGAEDGRPRRGRHVPGRARRPAAAATSCPASRSIASSHTRRATESRTPERRRRSQGRASSSSSTLGAVAPSHSGGIRWWPPRGACSDARAAVTSAAGSRPTSRFVPSSIVTGRSVLGRTVRQGTPSQVVSSWIPPVAHHELRDVHEREKIEVAERLE